MFLNKLIEGFFVFILFIVTGAFLCVILPYFSAILWSIVLALIFHPMKNKIQILICKCNRLSSLITIIIICLIVFIPLTIIISSLANELNAIYTKLQCNNTCFPETFIKLFTHVPDWIKFFFTEEFQNTNQIRQKISEEALKRGQYLAGSALLIGRGTFGFAVKFGIMLYLLFFLLKDGPFLVQKILNPLPLSDFAKEYLFSKLATVTRATVKGTIMVAAVQGTLGGIALFIVNVENSVLWGSIIAFLSLVPVIGSAIIWIPASIYLFATQQIWQGFFIMSFFIVIVGLVDNFLRPLLVCKDIKIPDYLIFISTLGGMEIYGINGFIIGPIITVLFVACWNLLLDRNNIVSKRKV